MIQPKQTKVTGIAYDQVVFDESTALAEPYGAVTISETGQSRVGDWIQTYTGIKFHPLDVHNEDIEIDDIAHALSLVNRFTGHTKAAYSVAEHSVRCSWLMPFDRPDLALEALLHDASEAYIADLARPIKMMPQMASYREMEAGVETAICQKWDLPRPLSREVKQADEVMLRTEARDLMGTPPSDWVFRVEAQPEVIKPWSADKAEYIFKELFYQLLERLEREG